MESRRALGLLIAVMAAIMILLAGRSCAKNIDKANQKAKQTTAPSIQIITGQMPTPAQNPAVIPQQPDELLTEDPTAPPESSDEFSDIPTTTKSKLDMFWDSEHPSYLDPYGFLDGEGNAPIPSVHIEIN